MTKQLKLKLAKDIALKLESVGMKQKFDSLPPSHKKAYLIWIDSAKKDETKQNRIIKMVEMLKNK